MKEVTRRVIEHIVLTSEQPYGDVKAALESRMSVLGNTDELVRQFISAKASWDQIKQGIAERMGKSGFTIFSKIEQGQLLAFAGKPVPVCQYAIGNPLLAIEMIEHVPEVALYAPLRSALYELEGKTRIAYDRFTSVLSSYQNSRIDEVAARVERHLEQLIEEALGVSSGRPAAS